MISRAISTSEKVHRIDWKARLLYTWMILHCDDEGRIEGSPITIKGLVFPIADCTIQDIEKWLAEMQKVGLIVWYKAKGKRYIQVKKWDDFQTFHGIRKTPSIMPSPPRRVSRSTKSGATRCLSKVKLNKVNEVKEVNEVKQTKPGYFSISQIQEDFPNIGKRMAKEENDG